MNKNYYEWLEINQNASAEIIEKAYKTLVKKYHPDLQEESQKAESEEILKKINEAYTTLIDPQKREEYDNLLRTQSYNIEKENEKIFQENLKLKKEINDLKSNNFQNNYNNSNYGNTYNQNLNNNSYNNNLNSNNFNNNFNNNLNNNFNNNINNPNLNRNFNNINNSNNINTNTNPNTINNQNKMNKKLTKKLEKARNQAYYDSYIQNLKNQGYKIKYKKTFKDYIRIIITFIVIILILWILWHIPSINNYFTELYKNNKFIASIVDIFINLFNSIKSIFIK